MAKNKIEHLRDHLFETIEMLKDGDMELDKARTIAEVAQVIINSAKVEVDDELAIKTCKMYNYKYAVITPDDIVIPPKDASIPQD